METDDMGRTVSTEDINTNEALQQVSTAQVCMLLKYVRFSLCRNNLYSNPLTYVEQFRGSLAGAAPDSVDVL